MQEHDLLRRMDNIHRDAVDPLSERITDRYEEMDMLVGEMMYAAKAQCRKLRTYTIPWYPAYKRACLALKYWFSRRFSMNKEYHSIRQLLVLQNKLKITYNPDLALADIKEQIKAAYKYRNTCKLMTESSVLSKE